MKFSKLMFLCCLLLLALTVLIACGKDEKPAPSSTPVSDSQQTSADGSGSPVGGSDSPSAGNGTQIPPAHVHSYDTVSVTGPTCDTKGYTTHTCSCGDHYEDTYVAATGHSWSETGADYFSCSTCTHTLDTSSATSAGLTYQAVFQNGSYTVIGYKVTGFTVEMDSFPSNLVIPPLHDGKPVIAIGDHAFSVSAYLGLERLLSVIIPDTVTTIEKYAFSNCTHLKTVRMPESIVKMGANPFNQTEYREMNTQNGLFYAGTALVSISWNIDNLVVREGTTVIADEACQTGVHIETVTLPEGLIYLGEKAFSGTFDLTTVYIPASLTEVGNSPFQSCRDLTAINYAGTKTQWNNIVNISEFGQASKIKYNQKRP